MHPLSPAWVAPTRRLSGPWPGPISEQGSPSPLSAGSASPVLSSNLPSCDLDLLARDLPVG